MNHIILLHGALGAKDQLNFLKDLFEPENFQVHSLSFSGHGQLPYQSDFGIEQFATDLNHYILKHNLIQPSVFGYSMGGYVALYLASVQPHLIGKIITLGTKFNWEKEAVEREIKMLNPEKIKEKVPKFAESLQKRHGENWELLLQKTATMMLGLSENNLLDKNQITKIKNKVLLGLAQNDEMVSDKETQFVFENLRNGFRYKLPNAKHPIETVSGELLIKEIKEFVKA